MPATLAMVRGRLPHGSITATSSPSETIVTGWLNYAAARIRSVLAAQGLPTAYDADTDADLIVSEKAVDYAEGRVRRAWASVEGDDENQDGAELVETFEAFIREIRDGSVRFGSELAAGDVPQAVRNVRGHVTDTPGTTTADFAPRVSMSEVID